MDVPLQFSFAKAMIIFSSKDPLWMISVQCIQYVHLRFGQTYPYWQLAQHILLGTKSSSIVSDQNVFSSVNNIWQYIYWVQKICIWQLFNSVVCMCVCVCMFFFPDKFCCLSDKFFCTIFFPSVNWTIFSKFLISQNYIYIYIYSIFNISRTLCLRSTKSHPCNSLLIIEGFPRRPRLHLLCPFWFYWIFNGKIIQNSITLLLGLVYTLQNPPLVHLHWELSNNTKVGGGGWLPWFGRSPCDKPKTNKQTNNLPQ